MPKVSTRKNRSRRLRIAGATSCFALTAAWPPGSLPTDRAAGLLDPRVHVGCAAATYSAVPASSRAVIAHMDQLITVSVPRTAILVVGEDGQIASAMTNTGCAPHVGDAFYVVLPDGSVSAANMSELAGRRWQGDFSRPGAFVPQGH